ncbi:hypothetical protein BD289DRAFT_47370 [Coniella lustricola]|uniref:Uncharacterized protein n=1 Tax=Coniella lustricola TaxID=2025994 RepID=A0A2T3AIE5_9PEZI|nr:hypothetical protein BD289DRAFT_47370 [Coniella lustricola]
MSSHPIRTVHNPASQRANERAPPLSPGRAELIDGVESVAIRRYPQPRVLGLIPESRNTRQGKGGRKKRQQAAAHATPSIGIAGNGIFPSVFRITNSQAHRFQSLSCFGSVAYFVSVRVTFSDQLSWSGSTQSFLRQKKAKQSSDHGTTNCQTMR